jgi:SAM-dependent methyltransferase
MVQKSKALQPKQIRSILPWSLLVLTLVLLNMYFYLNYADTDTSRKDDYLMLAGTEASNKDPNRSMNNEATSLQQWDPKHNPLAIPPGKAQNLPSIRVEDAKLSKDRKRYGGQGDKEHLGGFAKMDTGGISPALFKHMIEKIGVHSFLDIGCGRGFSTSWFHFHGARVLCAEGSHDAYEKSVLPDPSTQVVEHDFSRGPWWPEDTYDVVWSVEFLEHVNLQFQFNYVSAFRKAALLFVSASSNSGWHHVEVHDNDWWIRKFESYGFRYDEKLTKEIRSITYENRREYKAPNGEFLTGFYVWSTMMVFINPMVASLPEHAHLFPEVGCVSKVKGKKIRRKCSKEYRETPLEESMHPIMLTDQMDQEWLEWIKKRVG